MIVDGPNLNSSNKKKMFFLSRDFCLLIFRKNWIIKKSSKNKNIDQNNEKNIENNMILLFFIIIFPFCKNNLQKCFKKTLSWTISATAETCSNPLVPIQSDSRQKRPVGMRNCYGIQKEMEKG